MKVRCQFFTPCNVVNVEYAINWDSREAKRAFSSDADLWLRNGPGYRVETEVLRRFSVGDLCQCVVYCRRSDKLADLLKEANLVDEFGDKLRLVFDEVNYGEVDMPEGVPYICENSAGYEYPAATKVSDGKLTRAWTGNLTDGFAFAVTEAGRPIAGKAWEEFWSLLKRVKGGVM